MVDDRSFSWLSEVEGIIRQSLNSKLLSYRPETRHMPFHHRLLGQDRMALFSFIHSLNTTIGMSIYEPVAAFLVQQRFALVERQYEVGHYISENAQRAIESIMNQLTTGHYMTDIGREIEMIRRVCQQAPLNRINPVKVDLMARDKDGEIYLWDIKTAKPNRSNAKNLKRQLLTWVAVCLARQPDIVVHPCIAIPYNPYHPKPYKRWTTGATLSLAELQVGAEFWNFLSGCEVYQALLAVFQSVGEEMRADIDRIFHQLKEVPIHRH